MHKIVVFTLIFLSCFFINNLFCQEQENELAQQFNTTKIGSPERFELAADYVKFLFFNNKQDQAFKIINKEIREATKNKNGKYAANLYTVASIIYLLSDDQESSDNYSKLASLYAKKTKDKESKGYTYYGQGWIFARTDNEAEAIPKYLKALAYYENAHPSKTLFSRKFTIYTELSAIYANWNEFELQEKYTLLALKLAQKENNISSIFNANMAMGFLREKQFNLDNEDKKAITEAESYYLKAFHTFQQNSKKMTVPSDLSFVANNLAHLYLMYFPNSNESKVVEYAEIAIKQGKLTGQHNHVASAYGILADLNLRNGDKEKSKDYLLAAIVELDKNNIEAPLTKMNVFESLSTIHEQEGDYKEAIRYQKEYLELFKSYYDQEKNARAKKLETQYEKEKQKQQLLALQLESQKKEQQILKMNLLNIQQNQQLENLRLLKDNQQKEFELAQLEKSKQQQELRLSKLESFNKQKEIVLYKAQIQLKERINLFYIGIAVIVTLLLFAFIYAYLQRSKSLKHQKNIYALELEKERQNSKISNLTTMLDAQELERGRLARDLHDGLGGLLSGAKMNLSLLKERDTILASDNVNQSISKLDLAVDELRRVAHNLMPDLLEKYGLQEALTDYASRMSNHSLDIDVQFLHYQNTLSQEHQLLVYRILQELVNNVIKHAQATQIIIQFVEYDSHYEIVVEDDGKGFDTKINNSKTAGLHNIQSRIEFLKGKVTIDSQPDLGTNIDIQFPKTYAHD
ncbi:tetratricopeptide repeat-containing sensor histidine kinase [Sphingobacterium bovistauri]|uniref:Sensor histidine kinase n=1 Tax=Sphingobacterium bovistauri TaxID=2781959 RepID=A0ABS7Z6P1_9SPHI|nr:sensor histidine kinase [Sphingobacterium bovistauri]MCA5005081.1 sensor histidine kinase [Sphingobacterium bovistauri]